MSKEKLVPKLRFKEFRRDNIWELKSLEETVGITMGQSPSSKNYTSNPSDYILVQGNSDLKNGKVSPRIWTTQVTKKANKGDLILSVRAPVGDVGKTDFDVVLGRGVAAITGNEFIFQLLTKMKVNNYWTNLITGSTFESINSNDIKNAKVFFPRKEEQNKIGSFLKNIDKMIQLQQSKVNKVKDLKSAYLSEMFPNEGEKYPKKRFEGFTEPWEKYNLGEIGYTISGVGFPNSEQGGKKGIMFLKVSDMNLSENTTEINTSNNFVTAFQVHKRNWKVIEEVPALIFAKVGAALLLDRKRLVNDKFLIDNNMMAYILGEKLVADFTNALFKKIYLPKYAQIGALPSMNDSIVEKIEVLIPSLEEQEKIGKFFKNLDNQIYIEEEKLTKLEKLKQAYLNDMFV